jgi:hypothetical protein
MRGLFAFPIAMQALDEASREAWFRIDRAAQDRGKTG